MQIYNLSVVLYGVIYVYSFFRLYHNSFILGSNNAQQKPRPWQRLRQRSYED